MLRRCTSLATLVALGLGLWTALAEAPKEKPKSAEKKEPHNLVTIDVKGTPDVMAWLVGYEKKESTAFGADAPAFLEYQKEKTTGKPLDRKRNFESFISKYVWRGQLNARYAKPLENGWRRWTRDK